MVCEIELGISTADPIVVALAHGGRALTIDEDGPNVGPLKDVALHAQNRELLTWNAETRRSLSKLARLHLQEADVVRTNLPCELHTVIDRHWRTIVCQTN